MEFTLQQSVELASFIDYIRPMLQLVDLRYVKAMAESLADQAMMHQSQSIGNIDHDMLKDQLLLCKSKMLYNFAGFIERVNEYDSLQKGIAGGKEFQHEMNAIFLP